MLKEILLPHSVLRVPCIQFQFEHWNSNDKRCTSMVSYYCFILFHFHSINSRKDWVKQYHKTKWLLDQTEKQSVTIIPQWRIIKYSLLTDVTCLARDMKIYFRCQNVTEDSSPGGSYGSHSVRNRRASNTQGERGKERPLEKFWISYFNEVAGPGRVSRVPRGSDPCINCLRIELGERVCANGKIWIFLIMVLICSNSKSFRIGGRTLKWN